MREKPPQREKSRYIRRWFLADRLVQTDTTDQAVTSPPATHQPPRVSILRSGAFVRRMALAIDYRSELRCGNSDTMIRKGLGLGHFARAIGRKRVLVLCCLEGSAFSSPPSTLLQKRPGRKCSTGSLHLEALPQDILVHILCCVDHNDLKQLFHVSKSVRKAALIAEKIHFAFSTPPSKTTRLTTTVSDLDDADELDDVLNAPRQQRFRSRLSREKLVGISVALFPSPEEEQGA
ncbi:hypothetical protein AAC387_Pa07g0629 [Persea americana]